MKQVCRVSRSIDTCDPHSISLPGKIEIEPLRWSQNCIIDIYESMTVRNLLCSQRNLGSIIAEH